MSDESTTPETDEVPPVHFNLRNVHGDADRVVVEQHYLGLDRYLLITVGEEGPEVNASHLDFDELALMLGFVTEVTLQSGEVSEDTIADVRGFLKGAE
jgi:hypothetical protein